MFQKIKEKRKFGCFVKPVLWGDRFVGLLDAKADRKTNNLRIHKKCNKKSRCPFITGTEAPMTGEGS